MPQLGCHKRILIIKIMHNLKWSIVLEMKKIILLSLLAFLPLLAGAYDVEIDGIYYNLSSKTKEAKVTYKTTSYNSYSGSINIPSSITHEEDDYTVTSIGSRAFAGCNTLTSITISNNITSIDDYAFKGCSSLNAVHIFDLAVWCKISFNSYDSNPLYYAHHLFLNGKEVKDLVIPNSVTSIGSYTFSGCSCMISVTIPSSVISIGTQAFMGCSGLTSVHIFDLADWCKISFDSFSNPLRYAHHLYLNSEEVKDLFIPNSVTSIANAFSGCTGLTTVTIPNSVANIGENSFEGCSGITSVIIPNGVASIGANSFNGCSGLTSLNIPSSVTNIGGCSFSGCTGLTSVIIPNNVKKIEGGAFYGCTNLASMTIPNSVTSIGDRAFEECSGLTSLTISNNVTNIDEYVFQGCTGLTSVTIPNSVTCIRTGAFENCNSLISITIGSRVEFIGENAFARCRNLIDVYCLAENVPATESNSIFEPTNAFYNSPIETLYVPESSIGFYKTTSPWNEFGVIKSLYSETPETKQCAKPTINYENGKIKCTCETEDVTYGYTITPNSSSGTSNNGEISLGMMFNVSVYAQREGYLDSEVATTTISLADVGDMNGDGRLSVEDVAKLVDVIMKKE